MSLTACGTLTRANRDRVELPRLTKARLAHNLDEMAEGWAGMNGGTARKRREAEDRYEAALASFVNTWSAAQTPRRWQDGQILESLGCTRRFMVEFARPTAAKSSLPADYDDLRVAAPSRWRAHDTLALRPGFGVPLIGHIDATEEIRCAQPFLPPMGDRLTLTATMAMDRKDADGTQRCRLCLHHTLNTDTTSAPGGQRQLAADFTTPKQAALDRRGFDGISLKGLLFPEKATDQCQLYRMDEYDPTRIPVIFVHGLMCDPHIWLNAVNALCADDTLRRRYQPWYFLYPTAMSVPMASHRLRQALEEACQHFDPENDDPGLQNIILVGHSMGGLLSRLQVTDSGDKIWSALFRKPLTELDVSPSTRARLESTLFVKPQPQVTRTVFIATPHRGSKIASLGIVRRLTSLIRIPLDSITMANELLRGNVDALSPQITEWGLFSFVSVGMLSDKHPLLHGLDQTRPVVPHHSIIGIRGAKSLDAQAGDGVVPYSSAHLDSAASEKRVPHGHGCVEQPDVVAEVIRVLHEHLRTVRRKK
ncbi:MAG: alpha/beta hydrolase [Verrucomicrobiaceae bacterium]|nr:alpha/beta hydrolase [Verrucomicrobiaceae bacterium]